MKNNKGITLVALVVTIIVLIILAGISINLVLGDNGIITIAKKAKENTELAKAEEEKALNDIYKQLETEGGNSGGNTSSDDTVAKLAEFKLAIANAIDEAGGIKPEVTAETSVFADNIKGILKEVTKDATATADNISEGKTAWVNGELITGTGKDNETKYNEGTQKASFKISELRASKNYDTDQASGDFTFDVSGYNYMKIGSVWGSSTNYKAGVYDISSLSTIKLTCVQHASTGSYSSGYRDIEFYN